MAFVPAHFIHCCVNDLHNMESVKNQMSLRQRRFHFSYKSGGKITAYTLNVFRIAMVAQTAGEELTFIGVDGFR